MRTTALIVGLSLLLTTAPAVAGRAPKASPGTAANARLEAALLEDLNAGGLRPETARAALASRSAIIRRRAVQVIAAAANPGSVPLLARFAGDADPGVRAGVMLAAGRIGLAAQKIVARGLGDRAGGVRRAAVWAAAHLGPSLARRVTTLLRREADARVLETGLANLWRLPAGSWEAVAIARAGDGDPAVRRAAAFSLARSTGAAASAALERLARDADPVVRATAVGGFARPRAGKRDARVLVRALDDPDPRVVTAACQALAARQDVELSPAAGATLAGLVRPDRAQEEVAAIAALAAHREVDAGGLLREVLDGPSPWAAGRALVALARRGDGGAPALVGRWLGSQDPARARAAARACVYLHGKTGDALRLKMVEGGRSEVQLAWLEESERATLVPGRQLLLKLLHSPDAAVRAETVSLLSHTSEPPKLFKLLELARRWAKDELSDARAEAYRIAIQKTASAVKRAAIARVALEDPDWAVAARAVAAARASGVPLDLPRRRPRHPRTFYRDLAAWAATPRWLDIETVRGTVRIRLDTATAPLSARAVWDLAERGFYDGLTFHRVVPNFVVQGGDPRGDGWGGPGFALADEASLTPFAAGSVGIATSGPNTGGSQLFVTLMPADHLTGHYTRMGAVVAGREVLTRLEEGDRIRKVVPAAGPEPPPPVPYLVGRVSWRELAPVPGWQQEYDAYSPDEAAVAKLRTATGRYRIVAVLGSWCSDSRREVPRLEKILHDLGPGHFQAELFAVDRTLRVTDPSFPPGLLPGNRAERVPTIVVLDRDGQELGRIVETAELPIEDLLREFIAPEEGW